MWIIPILHRKVKAPVWGHQPQSGRARIKVRTFCSWGQTFTGCVCVFPLIWSFICLISIYWASIKCQGLIQLLGTAKNRANENPCPHAASGGWTVCRVSHTHGLFGSARKERQRRGTEWHVFLIGWPEKNFEKEVIEKRSEKAEGNNSRDI